MTANIPTIVVGLKTLTLVVGGLITYLAAKAARRTNVSGLGYLAGGFAIVTLGSLSAGVADQVFDIPAGDALILEAALTAVGFLVIAYSLWTRRGVV